MKVATAAPAAMRIGVFGGAFDPPHAAHVALATVSVANLQLDRLLIVPTGQAWHKSTPLSPACHRLAMARLAFAGMPQAVIDARETERAGPSYTVDTLRELKLQWPAAELYLIIGEDQARALANWHEAQEVLRLAIICVAEREHLTGDKTPFVPPKTSEARFRRLPMPAMRVSATEIRARVGAHASVVPLVIEPVARYIDEHHLYQTT